MSSLWTPGGERPVEPTGDDPGGPSPIDEEAVTAQVEAMRDELANAPVEVVLANHCYGLFELAAVYLSQNPPLLPQAQLAIDGLGALLDGLTGRLGDSEEQLKDGLAQLRLAYVQIDGAERAGRATAASAGPNGAGSDEEAGGGEAAGGDDADQQGGGTTEGDEPAGGEPEA